MLKIFSKFELIFVSVENSADILQEAKMQLWTNEECKHGHPFINADMVCAGYQSGYISSCLVSQCKVNKTAFH